ncbi:hypothetical protein FRC05_005066 [Tulasnella sp. 425]|nr:hypothetical protein FRC05_005066 [Tulasnella sp. 425]
MNVAVQNPLTAPVIEIPNPPDEFGQDGGKFYRCYDALAEEIDDDMTNGLKEQLDGMLIFAGLFAGVNTAFLALTIPLLSADPADDTNALLAQNNAILIQLVSGRNDTVPANSPVPSTSFSPSHDIFTINALFALSLAFAIISSFLAVLGRQWLVYYRKRGGGGPDRQRWEQLKRFLGAERWGLKAILDDVLPSLLQMGLIIFCISLILYLRHLSPAISIIVGMPLYVGLAFFVGSALCTIWDRFCPFHSPLSHMLLWISHALSWVGMAMMHNLSLAATFLEGASLKREEESVESLQAIALQRAICISDDPATLLHATANILSIRSPGAMTHLWDDGTFQDRFLQLVQNPSDGMLQLRGYNGDPKDLAESSRRLHYSAAAHIALTLDLNWLLLLRIVSPATSYDLITILVPSPLLQDSSSNLIRGNLGLNAVDAMESMREAFMALLSSESAGSWDSLARDTMLTNMLRCVEQIVADEQSNSDYCEILNFRKRQDK